MMTCLTSNLLARWHRTHVEGLLGMQVAKCCAALLAFWAFFCLLSYYALVRLYKRRQ